MNDPNPTSTTCPECDAERPGEMHADWCTYEGPEPGDEDGVGELVEDTGGDDGD